MPECQEGDISNHWRYIRKTLKIDNTKLSIVKTEELDYLYIYKIKLPIDIYILRKNGFGITKDQVRENSKRGQVLHLI